MPKEMTHEPAADNNLVEPVEPDGYPPVEEDATEDPTSVEGLTGDGRVGLDEGSGELVPISEASITTVGELLTHMRQVAIDDSEEIAARIAAKKLLAKNVAELNKVGELVDLASILNVPHLIQDVHWNESRIAGNEGAYVVFDAVNPYSGEVSTVGTGHQDVMITIYKAAQWDLLPCKMVFSQSVNPNRFGKPVYKAKIVGPDEE